MTLKPGSREQDWMGAQAFPEDSSLSTWYLERPTQTLKSWVGGSIPERNCKCRPSGQTWEGGLCGWGVRSWCL